MKTTDTITPEQTAVTTETCGQQLPTAGASVTTDKPTPVAPRLAYSVKEAAEILGVSEKTVRRLIDRRLLRVSRAIRHLLIPRRELERFLEETIT
jgi:excisionase family DNA binding protein